MTVLRSALLEREGFKHGFGTKRSIPDDFPVDIHILLQVHGERVVVLSKETGARSQESGENSIKANTPEKSGIWNLPFDPAIGGTQDPEPVEGESGIAGSNLDVKYVDLPPSPFRFDEGDAMVSAIPGVSMGIRTADCLPLLIVDRLKGTAAAVHCGWRSLALGLAGKAVRVMTGIMGSDAAHLLAAVGPSIGPCCYEVGEDVKEAFSHFRSRDGLLEQRDQGFCLDLASGVKTQLIMEGMAPENIDEIVGCTSCNPDLFWSHRARGGGGAYGEFHHRARALQVMKLTRERERG